MFWFFPRFRTYFSLQLLQFLLVGAQKYFLPPGAWYPNYATDKIIGLGSI